MGVNRSTISRWLQKYPQLIDADGLVDVDELQEHRRDVINPANQTKMNPLIDDSAPPPRAATIEPKVERENRRSKTTSLNDHRAQHEQTKAALAALDLAERLGETLSKSQVESAAAEAGQAIKAAAAEAVKSNAEKLATIDDVKEMELALQYMFDAMLKRAARALQGVSGSDDHSANAA